jgi:trimethylamine--corrinoid protein Co-methyltransferase
MRGRLKCWLTDDEIEQIHQSSLEILWERGMRVRHKGAVELLDAAGAKIDHDTHMVHFPPGLVEKCLSSVPKEIAIGSRTAQNDFMLGKNEIPYVRSTSGAEGYIDLQTRQYRLGTNEDLIEWTRLIDSLENVHICGGHFPIDAPMHTRDVLNIKTILENTAKPAFVNPYDLESFKAMVEMAMVVQGGKKELRQSPLITILTSATAPADILDYCVDIIFHAGEYGVPVEINSAPLMGGTAPVTIVGVVLQNNLEILSLAVISQLANPGAPLLHRGITMFMDMSSGAGLMGTVECGLAQAAASQVVQTKYNFPVVSYGLISDAKLADSQSQIERTVQAMLAGMTGSPLLLAAGFIEAVYSIDPLQLVIDNEIIAMFYRILRGVTVDEAALAKEIIKNTLPGGNYLTHPHTLEHFRDEHHIPKCFYRKPRADWEREGAKDMNQLTQERAIALLDSYNREPLPPEVLKELDAIYQSITEKKHTPAS